MPSPMLCNSLCWMGLEGSLAEREGFYTAVPKFPTKLAKSLLLKDRVSAHC